MRSCMAEDQNARHGIRRLPKLINFPGLLSVMLCMQLLPVCARGGQAEIEERHLQQIQADIAALKSSLESVRDRHASEQRALEKAEKEIGSIHREMRITEQELVHVAQQLVNLHQEHDRQRAQLAQLRGVLISELRSTYRGTSMQRIRMLLSEEDPSAVARMLVYQGYLARAHQRRLDEFRAVLTSLQDTEQALQQQQATQDNLLHEQRASADRLSEEKSRRGEIVAQLQRELDSGNERLSALEADQQRVSRLLESLREVFADIPVTGGPDKPFPQLRGQLEWPLAGKVSMPFGTHQAGGKMRTRGMHIASNEGAEVRAIAHGRIAFADWLRGFGLLAIVDHGDGYMSLYGENSSLYRSVGEWVERGDVIAAAGSSGGQRRTGLYLELRKDGRPIDPAGWFRGTPLAMQRSQ